jgi:hypothetical protein
MADSLRASLGVSDFAYERTLEPSENINFFGV